MLLRYAQRAAAFEAANPPAASYVIASALDDPSDSGLERPDRRLKQRRRLSGRTLTAQPPKRAATETQRMQQQVLNAMAQLAKRS